MQNILAGNDVFALVRATHVRATFSGLKNISTSFADFSANRFCRFSYDALMNAVNNGCGSSGFDLNSGWNWQPRKYGCSSLGNSTISTYVLSGVDPVIFKPAAVNCSSYSRLNS